MAESSKSIVLHEIERESRVLQAYHAGFVTWSEAVQEFLLSFNVVTFYLHCLSCRQ